jgi:hypothetical protein
MDGERRVTVSFVRFGELPRKRPRQVTADGSAVLTVRVGGPGRLILSGKHIRRRLVDSRTAANVGLPVVPKGEVAGRLEDGGSAKVAVRVVFTPTEGTRAVLLRTVPLKRIVRVLTPR